MTLDNHQAILREFIVGLSNIENSSSNISSAGLRRRYGRRCRRRLHPCHRAVLSPSSRLRPAMPNSTNDNDKEQTRLVPCHPRNALIMTITLDVVVSNAVLVLKALVQSQLQPSSSAVNKPTESPLTIISYLARRIDDIRHPQAKACVIWLVGQYSPDPESKSAMEGIADWAPDVLRRSAKTFIHEVRLAHSPLVLY